jgi:hypothetical protein
MIGEFSYNTGASSTNQAVIDDENTFAAGQENGAGANINADNSGNTNADINGNNNRESGEGSTGN